MAAAATIVPVLSTLRELDDPKIGYILEKCDDGQLVTQLEGSIEKLEEVWESLEKKEINELLQAVSRLQDSIDIFRIESLKRFYPHKAFGKVFSGVMSLRSSTIQGSQARLIKQMSKLVMSKLLSHIDAKSGDVLKEVKSTPSSTRDTAAPSGNNLGKVSSAGKVYSAKETGILDSNKQVNKLADFLIHGYLSPLTISVVDVPGSVMTIDLWKLYECETVKEHFPCRAWVPVPEELERREFVTDILKQVGGSEVGKQLDPQEELRKLFTKKRCPVAIINARTPDIWDILKYLFPNSPIGSRVILSFQEADAARCRNMSFFGGESPYKPEYMAFAAREVDGGNDDRPLPPEVPDKEISEEATAVVSMENDILKLAKLTLNSGDKNFLISVAGTAGSGKTALVRAIYDSSYTRRNFPCRAWANVYVSQDFDMRSVFADILKQLTQDDVDEESSLDDLESEFTGILYEKRYLVVLDDIHSPGAWYDLKRIFSPQASPIGSRVILITREAYVGRSFSPSIFLHQLRPLNRRESDNLFQKKFGSVERSSNLLETIYEFCGGLPVAISVVAGFLSNQRVSNWASEIKKIMLRKEQGASDNDQSTNLDRLSFRDISSIWVFANKSLSPHLKACLHYFRLFPESYEISVRRLLQLWLAERLVTPIEGNYEDQAHEDFDQLVRMNMIEVVKRKSDGRPKTCRVPRSLSDNLFPSTESGGVFCIHGVRSSNDASSSSDLCVRRLAEILVNRNNSFASDKHLERLHSYLSFDKRKGDKPAAEVGNLLSRTISKRGYRSLRVLDLERVYKPVLPETIGKLRLLRHVGLRWTFLDSMPKSLGDLPSLETLDVKHTNIATLPKSIWKSTTLRHLYMNDVRFQLSSQKSSVKSSSTNLRTLWGLLIGKKSSPLSWLRNSKELRKLGLTCHIASLKEITESIKYLKHLESLRLRSVNDFLEPSDLSFGDLHEHEKLTELYLIGKLPRAIDREGQLPKKLTVFTLSLSRLSKDPMPVLGQLQELKILRLFAHSYIGEEMTCQKDGFRQLIVLKLWVLKELKRWSIEKGTMPELRDLEIRRCQKLKNPFDQTLPRLKELTLTDMGKSFEDEVKQSLKGTVNVVIIPPVRGA